jgi:hypothetical protein
MNRFDFVPAKRLPIQFAHPRGALESITVESIGCAPSLKSKYTSASRQRRFITRRAVCGDEVRIVLRLVESMTRRISGGTACGSGGAVGGNWDGVGVAGN